MQLQRPWTGIIHLVNSKKRWEEEVMEKKDDVTFPVGKVVLQYVDDNRRFVGVVVDNTISNRLKKADREKIEQQGEAYHILLILGNFYSNTDMSWSVFERHQFPTYVVAAKGTATAASLDHEISLMKHHNEEPASRGLCHGQLHSSIFGFTKKQKLTLELVIAVQHYMSGGNEEDVPELIRYSFWIPELYGELQVACPR